MRYAWVLAALLFVLGTAPAQAESFFSQMGRDWGRVIDKIGSIFSGEEAAPPQKAPEQLEILEVQLHFSPAQITPEEVDNFRTVLGEDPQKVADIQSFLSEAGYSPGPEDGVVGPMTIAAIKEYWAAGQLAKRDTPELIEGSFESFALKEPIADQSEEDPDSISPAGRVVPGLLGLSRPGWCPGRPSRVPLARAALPLPGTRVGESPRSGGRGAGRSEVRRGLGEGARHSARGQGHPRTGGEKPLPPRGRITGSPTATRNCRR